MFTARKRKANQNGFPDASIKLLCQSVSVAGPTSMLSASAGRDSCQRISAVSSNANSVNFRNNRRSDASVPWPSLAAAAPTTCSMT